MKTPRLIWLLAILIIAQPGECAPKHWYRNWKLLTGIGLIGAVTALDAHSTCQGFAHGGVESSLILSGNESCGAEAGMMAGGFAFYTTLHALEYHFGHNDPDRFYRDVTPWMVPAVVTAIHLPAAIHNYESAKRVEP